MVDKYTVLLFEEHNRNMVYETVVKALEEASEEQGITRKQIAEEIGKDPSQISRLLSGPSNWTLDTISNLLLAIGAQMKYEVNYFCDQVKPNYYIPESEEIPRVTKTKPETQTRVNMSKMVTELNA